MTISLFPATDKIRDLLNEQLAALETRLGADFLCQHGPIVDGNETLFLRIVEQIANERSMTHCMSALLQPAAAPQP